MFYKKKNIVLALLIIAMLVCIIIGMCRKNCSNQCNDNYCNVIDTSEFVSQNTKNNIDLVKWAESAYENGWGYVWGTYGCVLDNNRLNGKIAQYPNVVGEYAEFIEQNWLGRRTTDCIGLIKGYAWYDANSRCFDYCINGMPDVGANAMFNNAEQKGEIDTIPEIPGLAVWTDGHIGVYIGSGYVIEAQGTREGVRKTRIVDREWTHWLKIPYIEYIDNQ